MNRLDYNDFRGWDLPKYENGADAGYIVQYVDGYISWSPHDQFYDAYQPTSGMRAGLAVDAMKKGLVVKRAKWAKSEHNGFFRNLNYDCYLNKIMAASPNHYSPYEFGQEDHMVNDWEIVD